MSTSSAAPRGQPSNGVWSTVAPYVIPPGSAFVAIIPVFPDLIAKSAQQKGQPIPKMTSVEVLKEGLKAAPTVGFIVGGQMNIQNEVEERLVKRYGVSNWATTIASSAIVGACSAPILAVFNGQTMKQTVLESLRKLSLKQAAAITMQETAFVAGLSVGDKVAAVMRMYLGDHTAIDYITAYVTGAAGSLAGHPANTALTRWQSGMRVESHHLMWGAARKARAVGGFAVGYKLCKNIASSLPSSSEL